MAVKVTVKKDSIRKEEPKVETKKTTTTCSNKCVNNTDVPVYTSIDGNIHVNKEYAKEFPEITLELVKSECRKSERHNECYANKWEGFHSCCEPCKCDNPNEDDDDIYDEEYGPEEETYTKDVLVPKIIKYLETLGFKVEEISKF